MKKDKKKKNRKRYWLLAELAVALIFLFLLLYKPAAYKKHPAVSNNSVSQYLTNDLLTQLYNGSQRQEPFDLVIKEAGLNDTIVQAGWSRESEGVELSISRIIFEEDEVIFILVANAKGVDLIVTAVIKPFIDDNGLLNLLVDKVKIGAVNVTPIAKLMASQMYKKRLDSEPIYIEDLRSKLAGAILAEQPFEPVLALDEIFKDHEEKLRIDDVNVSDGQLTFRLTPIAN